jgi:hypothetical protein
VGEVAAQEGRAIPLPALIVITILYVGVIWLVMKVVELSGGVAGQAFTVARSINSGVASWVSTQHAAPLGRSVQRRPTAVPTAETTETTEVDAAMGPSPDFDEMVVKLTAIDRGRGARR